mmetsp:Transcript_13060/g.18775  ORF Transcript_13060/g.18775 Transcript_13060/m.18775 type:complete len:104 (-) Transcript_13060:457-768(-)
MPEQLGGTASPDGAPSSNDGNHPFIGNPLIEFLKGYVYDASPKSKDQFSTTTECIGQYIQGNVSFKKGGGDFINAFNPNDLGLEDIPDPIVLEKIDDIVKMEI